MAAAGLAWVISARSYEPEHAVGCSAVNFRRPAHARLLRRLQQSGLLSMRQSTRSIAPAWGQHPGL